MQSFADRLTALRVKAGLTMLQLATKAGLSLQAIEHLEGGSRRRPFWETVQKLARAIGVSTDVFADTAASGTTRSDEPGETRIVA